MKLEYRYTDAVLERVDSHIDFRLRHARMKPRYISDIEMVEPMSFTYHRRDISKRVYTSPVNDYFVTDTHTGKQIIYPSVFWNTSKLQRQARSIAIKVAARFQHRYAVFGKVA